MRLLPIRAVKACAAICALTLTSLSPLVLTPPAGADEAAGEAAGQLCGKADGRFRPRAEMDGSQERAEAEGLGGGAGV